MSQKTQKTKTKKADPDKNMGNSSKKGKDSWTSAYDDFLEVLDRNTIQVKNLSETISELDALKNLTQNASTLVLKAVTIFLQGSVGKKKFLSPDQINSQIRKITDAESLLLETRREVETVDEGLKVDGLRAIRKRFSRVVHRAESLSLDIKNDRTLLSELEEAITLAMKKTRAEVQLTAARKEASSSAHEIEALTTARKKLLSAIEKAKSVGIEVSSDLSLAEEIQNELEKAHEKKNAQSKLQKVISKVQSVPSVEGPDALSRLHHELASAIESASAAGIETGDARKIVNNLQKSVSAAKKRVKAKVEAQQVLESALVEAKSVSDDSDIAVLRSVKKKLEKAIEEARILDIDVKTEESQAGETAKSVEVAERKGQANKQLQAAHHKVKSIAGADDCDLLVEIHEELQSVIRNASIAGIDVTDDRVIARGLKVRIGVIQNHDEALTQLNKARKKSVDVALDGSSQALRKVVQQLSVAIDRAQAAGMDESEGYFGGTFLKPDRDRLEEITNAINKAKKKEYTQRLLSTARKKATTLPTDPSADSVREARDQLLKSIDNAKKVGLQVSQGMLGSRLLDADQRLLDDLDEAEDFAEKSVAVRTQLSFLSVEIQSLGENAEIETLQELGDKFTEAVNKGTSLGLKLADENKLLNDLNGAIDFSEKRSDAISELTESQEQVRSLAEDENLESLRTVRDRLEKAVYNARTLRVETTEAETQLSALNSKVNSAADKITAEAELRQAQKKANSLSKDSNRKALVEARDRLVAAVKRGKKAGINITGVYFGKSIISVAEDRIGDLAESISLVEEKSAARNQLLDARKEAKSFDRKRADETSLQNVRDNMASAVERAEKADVSTEGDKKLLVELEKGLSNLVREKSDALEELETISSDARSASVGDGFDKLVKIRENLISAISLAQAMEVSGTNNQKILGQLSEKIEIAREKSEAEAVLIKVRRKIKDNLPEPHTKTLLSLQKSLSSAIARGELAGLDISGDKDLSSNLGAAIAVAQERDEVESYLNAVRGEANAAATENGSVAVEAVHVKLQAAMVRGDSFGVNLTGDSERLEHLATILEKAKDREGAITQLQKSTLEVEAASGDAASLENIRDRLIFSMERCTTAGVDVSSEQLLVDKLNQNINAIREKVNAEIELDEARMAAETVSGDLNAETLSSNRDRLSAAIERAQLSAIDVSTEQDKLHELENAIVAAVEKVEAESQLANAKESVNEHLLMMIPLFSGLFMILWKKLWNGLRHRGQMWRVTVRR